MFDLKNLERFSTIAKSKGLEPLLETEMFRGLADTQPWFDSPAVRHFDAVDFRIFIERCSFSGIRINGVEVSTLSGELLEVRMACIR